MRRTVPPHCGSSLKKHSMLWPLVSPESCSSFASGFKAKQGCHTRPDSKKASVASCPRPSHNSSDVTAQATDGSLASAHHPDTSEPTRNFHLTLHQVFRNPGDASKEQLERLQDLTLARVELDTDALVTVVYAFARCNAWVPDPHIMERCLQNTQDHMSALSPRQLYNTAWGLRCLTHRARGQGMCPPAPGKEWLAAFDEALQASALRFTVDQLIDTAVAAAQLGCSIYPFARNIVAESVLASASNPAVKSGWATPLSVADSTSQDYPLDSAHFARGMWLLGSTGHTGLSSQQVKAVVEYSKGVLDSLVEDGCADDGVMVVHGVASLPGSQPGKSWVNHALACSEQWLSGTPPEEASSAQSTPRAAQLAGHHYELRLLVWGLNKLEARPASRWGKLLVDCLLVDLQFAAPRDVIIILLSLAGLGLPLPDMHAIAAYFDHHKDVLTLQQLASLQLLGLGLNLGLGLH